MSTLAWLRQHWALPPDASGRIWLPQVGRKALRAAVAALGFTRGAEIGVWRGALSAAFCEAAPSLHMLCVDPWASYPGWLDTKNALPRLEAERLIEDAYRCACERLTGLNCSIARAFSVDAAREVPDGSLDFVYIDANHAYEAVLEDLTVWTPKIRSGGILAGHDYRNALHKPTIQVVEAVCRFVADRKISPWFVLAAEHTPSYAWVVS